MLQFNNVELYYNHVYALKQVSIQLQKGETVALIGANGAGKSSILRAITGLNRIKKGSITFQGKDITRLPPAEIVKRGISMVPEGRHVFPYMSVRDNLLMGAFTRDDKKEKNDSMEEIIGLFPILKERFSQSAGTLSGGEQQMLVIGRALMSRPKLLLLDEPSLGVAPILVAEIARAIVKINKEQNVSVLLVEQNSRMALKISQRAYALTTGSVTLSGRASDLIKDERVKAAYLGGEVQN